jgi:hypothetical protein
MSTTAATRAERPEELRIFVERFMHFMNLWTIYKDILTGHYLPSVGTVQKSSDDNADAKDWPVNISVMFILYAYFYSLVGDSDDGLNGFRIWRKVWPNEEAAISAVESMVLPFVDRLRVFRNRLGFHGSRTRTHEAAGFDLFSQHAGDEIYNAMRLFKSLGAALLGMDTVLHKNDSCEQARCRAWIDKVAAEAQKARRVPTP